MTGNHKGFTLVEVSVALVLGGIVVLVAASLHNAVADGTARIRSEREALDRSSNARRWLGEAFLSLDVSAPAAGFVGRAETVDWSARVMTANGWPEVHRVHLAVRDRRLVATLDRGSEIVLAPQVEAVAFDYLLVPGENARWVREWISPSSAPLAIRVRLIRRTGADTALFVIKERG